MPKCKNGKKGIGKLANFNLIVDNKRLMMTCPDLAEIERVKGVLGEDYPQNIYLIENFGVQLDGAYHSGSTYQSFKKTSGYSLWQKLK